MAEGSGDQKAIIGAICAVEKAAFDGVDCVGGDDAATGTVRLYFMSCLVWKNTTIGDNFSLLTTLLGCALVLRAYGRFWVVI